MTRRSLIGSGVLLALVMAGLASLWWRPALFPPVDSKHDAMTDMPGMVSQSRPTTEEPEPNSRPEPAVLTSEVPGIVTVPVERLQMIGVKYQPVTRRPLEKLIRTVGRVAVDERKLATVTIKFHGWIEDLFVSALGDHVKRGQQLFTIYSPDLVASQEEYLLALQGQKQLGGSEFPEVARGSRDLLEATKRRFQLWDITEDHLRELERTGTVMKALPIHSPITGTVIRKDALAGAHVDPGEELYTIADLSHLWILADIYEYELSFVKVGQQAAVTLSYDPGTVLSGQVSFIYPTLDPKTRTAKVRFELDNREEKLKPDMYANVELGVELGMRLAIPQAAIIESGEKQIVFLHLGEGRLEPRLIKTGVKTGDWSEVLDGLKEGEHIVTSANFLIDSESRLKSVVEGMGGMPGMKMKD
ncbi:MAG: Cation efflux system protein CusB [Nitrospirae bacterium]|nr:MAG: secretion protein (HlyD) [Nitrospira sp. OLB3]MBV6471196.1 Cation efflux system protein CusB [Nitrospirota bacterium]MCE7964680.1 efflux RND transporter periplasmic adaptor subunit [Nitrospira sp. NTP2]QOJ35202.1 MAG: efflux RND transporter periplasmic adaptor subunit [Nitrospira sp.]RIK57972.1 MAG: efflux RND transporter periplasmic adaptor subunit [Nitrospira sp.]